MIANREFEAWLIASAESLRGIRGLRNDIVAPGQPEAIRGAKEWLSGRMSGRTYRATRDQAALASRIDLQLARRAPSFDRFCREIERLIVTARG